MIISRHCVTMFIFYLLAYSSFASLPKIEPKDDPKNIKPNYKMCKPGQQHHYSENHLARIVNLTLAITKVFDKANVWNMVIGGSLLGAVRHGTQTPWDNDIDMAVRLADVDKILSLKKEFHAMGYVVNVIWRLIKIAPIGMDITYHHGDHGNAYKVWADIFVYDSSCAVLAAKQMQKAGYGTTSSVPVCRCYCFSKLDKKRRSHFDPPHDWNCKIGKCPDAYKTRPKLAMPGICAPLSPKLAGGYFALDSFDKRHKYGKARNMTLLTLSDIQRPYLPDRKQLPFGGGFVWGFTNSEEILDAKYPGWRVPVANAAQHGKKHGAVKPCIVKIKSKNS